MWHANDGMGWWMLFGSLLWLIFLGAVVYLIASIVTRSPDDRRAPPGPDTPLEIARRRYAAGEIGREEFHRLRGDLAVDRPHDQPP